MDICYLVNHLKGDGAQRLILNIIENSSEDIRFTTCAIEAHNPLAQSFREAGSRVVSFDGRSKYDGAAMRRLIAFFRANEFDVLHTHLPYSQIVGRLVGKGVGAKNIVSTQHNVPPNYHRLERALERATRPIDSATIAVSNGVREQFRKRSSAWESARTDWHTIHNGIDVAEFNRRVTEVDTATARDRWNVRDDELLFLNVSRYVPAKAQLDVIRAMADVGDVVPHARLFIVGGGQLEGQLREAVANLDLQNQVTIAGRVSDRSIYELYSIADAFVFPSIYEGFGIVLLEAMASELPVVATDIPGVNEVVTDETGYLVPPRTPAELADRMIALRSPDVRRQKGAIGFQRARERFDIERVAEAHVRLYRALADPTARAGGRTPLTEDAGD